MKRSRRHSFNDPGHVHFLTFSCYRCCQLFTDDSTCSMMGDSLEQARRQDEFDLWSYVFMPDHVHLLVRPRREEYSMSHILKVIKGPFAKRLIDEWKMQHTYRLKRLEIRTSSRIGYRVWQRGGGFDRNLFSHDLIRRAIAYIEDNPVRKGFVSDPVEWKWSSARARLGYIDVPLRIDEVNWELVDVK